MPHSISPQTSPSATQNSSLTTSRASFSFEPVSSPLPDRASALSHLRFQSNSLPTQKDLAPLVRTQSERTMSVYSGCTSYEQLAHLPTSSSEITLVQSITSSGRESMKDEQPAGLAKLVHRSSRMMLRKKGSKASIAARTLEWLEEDRAGRDVGDLVRRRKSKHGRTESDGAKMTISQPFNFQHLTHTAPVQANVLRKAVGGKLASEFSAIRAAQIPSRDLKGIQTEELGIAQQTSVERTSPDRQSRQLRASKSMDSFKRYPHVQAHAPVLPPVSPPRASLRKPVPTEFLPYRIRTVEESPTIPRFVLPGNRPRTGSTPKSPLSVSSGVDDSPLALMDISQVMATSDQSLALLEEVPEEDDLLVSTNAARRLSTTDTVDAKEATNRMLRSGSDPVLPPVAAQAEEIPVRLTRRNSRDILALVCDWDDDIDYCYDHALEAENVDPISPGVDSPISDVEEMIWMHGRYPQSSNKLAPSRPRRPSALASPMTAPTEDTGSDTFCFSPSMLVPREYSQLNNEDDIIEFDERRVSHRHHPSHKTLLPLFTPDLVGDLAHGYPSPRSSVSHLSIHSSAIGKRTSSLLTDGASAKRISSSTSIPDLVHSSNSKPNCKSTSIRGSVYAQMAASSSMAEVTAMLSAAEEQMTLNEEKADVVPLVPQRERSCSDSAGNLLGALPLPSSATPFTPQHARSTTNAATFASTSAPPISPRSMRSPRPQFAPLDRIGASAARA